MGRVPAMPWVWVLAIGGTNESPGLNFRTALAIAQWFPMEFKRRGVELGLIVIDSDDELDLTV